MGTLLPAVFFPKYQSLSLIMRKTSDKPNGGKFHKISDQYYVKAIKKKKNLTNCHKPEEITETWLLNKMWDSDLNSGIEKGH